jgi:hypothetical protein
MVWGDSIGQWLLLVQKHLSSTHYYQSVYFFFPTDLLYIQTGTNSYNQLPFHSSLFSHPANLKLSVLDCSCLWRVKYLFTTSDIQSYNLFASYMLSIALI